ncbi:DUF726 domain-containing protein [Pseudomonas sp. DTU_2021_1001937_2_SI_NGA_ILE_001]|uniref:DUF726 domain-containing protein n=1 Tax=Pseudomonas sp. DTU_2021_1001937_2_SI_NGA_ILE_001 TaxID=3077589 RepID=UPI0028FC1C19|nr:DUF726 domain-containing protein [Pseudomonas sp. DTU_2021_1001937_2_SI_NGA_ILE_001]WNW12024.1 DUF726 domain-containing protein [Pseudomonas sp. DTU_2021_1001937_2_SI_NGA_ILE_001]
MDTRFKFLTLPKATGSVANIFIHGYSAGHDLDDRRLLAGSIPEELRQSVNVLAFWPSSHFMQMDNRSRGLLVAAVRLHPLAGAAALAGDRAWHFAQIRSRAEGMGRVLLEQLAQYLALHHPQVTQVNFIGHSLGGRVLVSMLRHLTPDSAPGLAIGDVLLMAAAVRVEAQEAEQLRASISGRLINAWSSEDPVLLLNLGERSLGRMAVEHFDNVRMVGYRHHHYWKRLREVLVASGFSGFAGQQADPQTLLVVNDDPVLQDTYLHAVLQRSPGPWLDEAIKHLCSSRWTRISDEETDRVYAFAREFQRVGGHFLLNAARRRGVPYTRVLGMLARQYGLGQALHHCATVVEVEALLLRTFFRQAFIEGHPLALASPASVRSMPWAVYAGYVDQLAERLTLARSFRTAAAPTVEASATTSLVVSPPRSTLKSLLGAIRRVPVQRLFNDVSLALKPGYSALIPAVAIVFYARVALDDETLM